MKKRDIWKFLILIFLMGFMGCGDKAQQGQTEKPRKLLLWSYYETEAQQQGLDELVKGFNESQDEYEISWEYVPIAEFTKNLSFSKSSDNLPDLVLVDNPDMESLIKIGLLADITEELEGRVLKEEYYSEVWKSVEYEGRYYGVPFCCNNTAIIYNKEIFREKNLKEPATWSDFREVAKKAASEGSNGHYGFVMSAARGEQGAFQFMPWILATGADTENLTDEKAKEAFRLMDELLDKKIMPNDCMNWSQNDVTRSFVAGKTAMIENGPWALPDIEKSGIDYGICKLPDRVTGGVVLGGENLAAVEGKNTKGATAFINYYNREEVMEEICQITRNIPPKVELAKAYGEKNPDYQVFVSQMENGISRSSIRNWKNVCRALSDSLNQMFGSEDDIEKIWEDYISAMEQE